MQSHGSSHPNNISSSFSLKIQRTFDCCKQYNFSGLSIVEQGVKHQANLSKNTPINRSEVTAYPRARSICAFEVQEKATKTADVVDSKSEKSFAVAGLTSLTCSFLSVLVSVRPLPLVSPSLQTAKLKALVVGIS